MIGRTFIQVFVFHFRLRQQELMLWR